MVDDVIRPEEFAERTAANLAALTHSYVAIVMLDVNGRVTSKGSGVLVRVGADHFVFTAAHVVRALGKDSAYIVLRPAISSALAMRGHVGDALQFAISPSDIAWVGAGDMDVAALRAPLTLVKRAYLRWFDASECVKAIQSVRRQWGGTPVLTAPTVIMGCPNFGHFKDGGVDTISLLTMITHISTLDPEPWDGVSRLPQIALAVVDGPRTEPAGEAGGRRQLQENLSRMVDKGTVPPLGGFSGAPLVVIGSDGEFLIGIVVEGDYVFTAARVIAIAWDDIMNTFGRRTI